MFKVGDVVFFENPEADDADVDIIQSKIKETHESPSRSGTKMYYSTEADELWYSQDELFTNKTDLVDFMYGQTVEDKKHIMEDVEDIEQEVAAMKKQVSDLDKKLKALNAIKG